MIAVIYQNTRFVFVLIVDLFGFDFSTLVWFKHDVEFLAFRVFVCFVRHFPPPSQARDQVRHRRLLDAPRRTLPVVFVRSLVRHHRRLGCDER